MAKIKITNQELYDQKVVEVELNHIKKYNGTYHGNVAIEVEGEGWREYDGEHGAAEYEDDFGFRIVDDWEEEE